MPQAQQGFIISDSAQLTDGVVKRADLEADIIDGTKIADDVVDSEHYVAASIDNEHLADNAVADAEIAAHTTTKITVPATLFTVASQAQGDIIFHNGTNWVRLAAGTSGQFLKTQGAAANPVWAAAGMSIEADGSQFNGINDSAEQTAATITVGAGRMGANGAIRITVQGQFAADPAEVVRVKFGGTTFYTSPTIGNTGFMIIVWIQNRNDVASQMGGGYCLKDGAAMLNPDVDNVGTVNTAIAQDVVVTVQEGGANGGANPEIYTVAVEVFGTP